MKPGKASAPRAGEPEYVPSEAEKAVLRKEIERRASSTAPRIKVDKGANPQAIEIDHPDRRVGFLLLTEALGSGSGDFTLGLLTQLANAGRQGLDVDEGALNFMLSVVKDIKPRDHIESMLAAQMSAVHLQVMTFARRLANVENIPQQDSAERAFNKLARTFATQMEALKRYRTGGEQKVTVQHVSVSEGGQAIVGNVTQAAPNANTPRADSAPTPPALTHSQEAPMTLLGEPERVPAAAPAAAAPISAPGAQGPAPPRRARRK